MEYLELTKEEEKDYIQQLYHAFATGRDFELFLNYFLKRIGFQEVVTTKYVKDNGIDLILHSQKVLLMKQKVILICQLY